jgi:proteasome accessory factor B
MAARRQQRLVNLVLCLLSTRQFITAERIRSTVEGYEVAADTTNPDEAFKRSFERDKAELRELGVPLETGRNSFFDTEDGYRIARQDFELPPIEFTADEAAAVGLAARLWSSASLAPQARTALIKLRAAGIEIDNKPSDEIAPLAGNEPALPSLLAAVASQRPVSFSYRKPNSERAEKRTVEPWGVLSWRGRWYLVGHDRGRGEARSFRLDRITGEIKTIPGEAVTSRPDGLDLLELVRGANLAPTQTATVQVAVNGAGQLHRLARDVKALDDGAEMLLIEFTDTERLAGLIAAAGTAARAVEPPDLVAAVVALLSAVASR